MPEQPLAVHAFQPGEVDAAVAFLRRTRFELRMLRMVRVYRDRFQVYDVNRDYFEIRGIGYVDPEILPLLDQVNTAYNPETIHAETSQEFKELLTGRRYPWAQDRVM